jgi:hypothetical protein
MSGMDIDRTMPEGPPAPEKTIIRRNNMKRVKMYGTLLAAAALIMAGCSTNAGSDNSNDNSGTTYETTSSVTGTKTVTTKDPISEEDTNPGTIAAPTNGWGRSNYTYTFATAQDLSDMTITVSVTGTGGTKPDSKAADGLKVYFISDGSDTTLSYNSAECITLGWLGTSSGTLSGSVENPKANVDTSGVTSSFDITKVTKVVIMNYMYTVDSSWDCATDSGVAAVLTDVKISASSAAITGTLDVLPAMTSYSAPSGTYTLDKAVSSTGKFTITIKGNGPTAAATKGSYKNLADGIKVVLVDSDGTAGTEYGLTDATDKSNPVYNGYFTDGTITATITLSDDDVTNLGKGIAKIKLENYTWATDDYKTFENASAVGINSITLTAVSQ